MSTFGVECPNYGTPEWTYGFHTKSHDDLIHTHTNVQALALKRFISRVVVLPILGDAIATDVLSEADEYQLNPSSNDRR